MFKDKRLTERFKSIVSHLSKGNGKSIPEVCEQWSMTKAAYRFLSNDRVEENEILAGHFNQTGHRLSAATGPILGLHDTTEFTYHREESKDIGFISRLPINKKWAEELGRDYKSCGILMHASLAITPEGLPPGLTATKFWARTVFKQTNQLKRHVNPTRIPIDQKESIKWLENLDDKHDRFRGEPDKLVHIGDRESDIYELFCRCQKHQSYFIIRSCVNRLANGSTLVEEVATHQLQYQHAIEYRDANGDTIKANLTVKAKRITLHPPVGKESMYPSLLVTVVSAVETDHPQDRAQIKWTFLTNLSVKNKSDAVTVLEWYKQRWKIEVYFKILKSGLKVEESKLRTADRLARLIAICCILAWRIYWLTMLNQDERRLAPQLAFDNDERMILQRYFKKLNAPQTLQDYITRLAKLGGYLARANDPPPDNTVIWRRLNKLYTLVLDLNSPTLWVIKWLVWRLQLIGARRYRFDPVGFVAAKLPAADSMVLLE